MTALCDDNQSGRNHSVGANSRSAVQKRQSERAGTRACPKSGPTVLPSLTGDGTDLALAFANWLTNALASSDQRPPTSAAKTTNELVRGHQIQDTCAACDDGLEQVPRHPRLRTDGEAAHLLDTSVVSIANWAPPNRGEPSATTSRRRPSCPTTARSKSRTKTFVEAPASRQTRAAALSTEKPRPPRTPALAHAAR